MQFCLSATKILCCVKMKQKNRFLILISCIILAFSLIFLAILLKNSNISIHHDRPVIANVVTQLENPVTEKLQDEGSSRPLKRILLWTPFWGRQDHGFGFGHVPFLEKGCDVTNCETTFNRRLLIYSDAVVFHWGDTFKNDIPAKSGPDQVWVMWNHEPEGFVVKDDHYMDNKINWTMTYRLDSDIVVPYGEFVSIVPPVYKPVVYGKVTSNRQERNEALPTTFNEMVGVVSWLVSSCSSPGKRHLYVNELKKYIKIDIYGKCGTLTCPRGNRSACNDLVYNKYKFYLSFENSLCTDYVTEKFFNPLKFGIAVPVVYGAADYRHIAPPHSYIDTKDFKSPRHLAEYLKMLDGNDGLYWEYHAWRTQYSVRVQSHLCYLCAKLNSDMVDLNGDRPVSVYSSYRRWWLRSGDCERIWTNHL